MTRFRYPLMGRVDARGFGAFLEAELGESRANLRAFARELALRFGASRATLVSSGSSANLVAALALRERVGSRAHAVISAFTFPTTASALLMAGFDVTVVDTLGFGIDPESVRRALRPDTGAIAATHFLGFPADIDAIVDIARERDILVLQDGCETMDLRIAGTPAHTRGTLTTWSFYHPHHLSAYGGGAVISNDDGNFELIESLAHWGRACRCHLADGRCDAPEGLDHQFWYVRQGVNVEMSELNACFGRFQLRAFDTHEATRRSHYARLQDVLSAVANVETYATPGNSGTPFVFPVTLRERSCAELAERLTARGVEIRSLMGGPIVRQPAFSALAHDGLRNATGLAERTFFLGIHQTLPADDIAAVAEIVRDEVSR